MIRAVSVDRSSAGRHRAGRGARDAHALGPGEGAARARGAAARPLSARRDRRARPRARGAGGRAPGGCGERRGGGHRTCGSLYRPPSRAKRHGPRRRLRRPGVRRLHGRRPHPLRRRATHPRSDAPRLAGCAPRRGRRPHARNDLLCSPDRLWQDRSWCGRRRHADRRGAGRDPGRAYDHGGQPGSLLCPLRDTLSAARRAPPRQQPGRALPHGPRGARCPRGAPGPRAADGSDRRGRRNQHAGGARTHGSIAQSRADRPLDGGRGDVRGPRHRLRRPRGHDRPRHGDRPERRAARPDAPRRRLSPGRHRVPRRRHHRRSAR